MLPTHWLISIKNLNMSYVTRMCNTPYVKESKGKNPGSVPSSGSQLKVNGVFFGLRPILHPMFIEIWLVVFVWSCSQTTITTNSGWKGENITPFFCVEHLLLLLILQWHFNNTLNYVGTWIQHWNSIVLEYFFHNCWQAEFSCSFHLKFCPCVLILFMQKNQGILLGVVGTDIPLQELMKLIPKHMVQSAVLVHFALHKLIHNHVYFLNYFPCVSHLAPLVRNPRVRVRYHEQRLHPDTPGTQTLGNPVS